MSVLRKIWETLKSSKYARIIACAMVLFLSGYLIGRHHKVPVKIEQHAVEDVISKQKLAEEIKVEEHLREQIAKDEKLIADLKISKTTHTHIVKRHDGTVVIDKTTKTDEEKHTEDSKHTDKVAVQDKKTDDHKVEETQTQAHAESTTITTPQLRDNFYLGVFVAPNLHGISDPGVELKWSPFTHAWVGASLDTSLEFRIALGLSFNIDG